MKKTIILLCSILLSIGTFAKDGKIKYGNVIYKGEVENDNPMGEGALYYKGSDVAFLNGKFTGHDAVAGEDIKDAVFTFSNIEYKGRVCFKPSINKNTNVLAEFTLKWGEIKNLGYVHDVKFQAFGDVKHPMYTISSLVLHEVIKQEGTKTLFLTADLSASNNYDVVVDSIRTEDGGKLTPVDRSRNLWKKSFSNGYIIGTLKDGDISNMTKYGIKFAKTQCYAEADVNADSFTINGKKYTCDKGYVLFDDGDKFVGSFIYHTDKKPTFITGTLTIDGQKCEYKDGENLTLAAIEKAKAAAIAKQVQDSIDIAEGRKLPSYSYYLKNCYCKNISKDFEETLSEDKSVVYPEYFASTDYCYTLNVLCENDILTLLGKNGMSDLDRYKWEKSSEYKNDLQKVGEIRNRNYGLLVPLYKNKPKTVNRDGCILGLPATCRSFPITNDANLKEFVLLGSKILFPLKKGVLTGPFQNGFGTISYNISYKTNNINTLEKIQDAGNKSTHFLFIFKPSLNPISDYAYFVNPVGLYLVNTSTGETLADLSSLIRKYNAATDNAKLKAAAKAAKAQKSAPRQKSKHYCTMCSGKGYRTGANMGGVRGKTTETCFTCGGTGYVYY